MVRPVSESGASGMVTVLHKPDCRLFIREGLGAEEALTLIRRSQDFSSLSEEERRRWQDAQSLPEGEGLLQNRPNRCIVLVRRPDGSPVCVKRYRCRGWWDALLGTLGWSRARLAWRHAEQMRQHGFAVLLPLALCEEKSGAWVRDSYLISPALDHRARLDRFIAEQFHSPLSPSAIRRKRQLLRCLARCLQRLHEHRIYYREMQIDNLFVEEVGTDGWQFLFVDFDRMRIGKPLSLKQRAKNLAGLRTTYQKFLGSEVSEADQVRFLLAYTQGTPWRRQARKLLSRVQELTSHRRR